MDIWSDCSAWSRRILTAADRLSGYRHVRQRRFEDWWVHPDSADAVVRTLLALGIHSLVLDAMAQGRPYTPARSSPDERGTKRRPARAAGWFKSSG